MNHEEFTSTSLGHPDIGYPDPVLFITLNLYLWPLSSPHYRHLIYKRVGSLTSPLLSTPTNAVEQELFRKPVRDCMGGECTISGASEK